MKMNTLLAAVAVGGLLLLVGRYQLAPHFLVTSSTPVTESATITVTGHSDESLSPDTALVDATVVTNAATAAAAEQQNTQAVKTVLDALAKAGVQKSDARTIRSTLQNPAQTSSSTSPNAKSFQAAQTLEVKVSKLSDLGSVADTLVKAGATQITRVAYQNSQLTDAEQQGYTDALADAKGKADSLVQAMGATLSGIQSVDTARTTSPAGSDGSASDAASAGSENLSTTVTVVYTIGNADNNSNSDTGNNANGNNTTGAVGATSNGN